MSSLKLSISAAKKAAAALKTQLAQAKKTGAVVEYPDELIEEIPYALRKEIGDHNTAVMPDGQAYRDSFSGPYYHGTFAPDIKEFDPALGDIGTHMGTPSQAANRLSDITTERKGGGETYSRSNIYLDGANILPLQARQGKSLNMPDVGLWKDSDKVVSALEDVPEFKGQLDDAWESFGAKDDFSDQRDWLASGENSSMLGEANALLRSKGYDSVRYDNAVENDFHGLAADRPEVKAEREAVGARLYAIENAAQDRHLQREGKPSLDAGPDAYLEWLDSPVSYTKGEQAEVASLKRRIGELNRETKQDASSTITLDPANIRSTNAVLDPAKKGSSNLLASGVAGLGLGAGMLGSEEAEAGVASKALDMSTPARMARAKAMGFDVDNPVYHGTSEDFDAFDPDRAIGTQFWSTDDRAAVESGEVGAQGKGVIKELYQRIENPAGWDEYDNLGIDELIGRGYDGIKLPDSDGSNTYVAFKPEQYRDVNAAFDPANRDSANLLASGVAGLGLGAGMLGSEEAEAGPLKTFANITKRDFLGDPIITSNANAAQLQPRELKTTSKAAIEPFAIGDGLTAKYSDSGATVYDGDTPVASYNFGDTLAVDKGYRRQGIGEELAYQWRTRNPQAAPATERTKASQQLQENVWDRIQRGEGYATPQVMAATGLSGGAGLAAAKPQGMQNYENWFNSLGGADKYMSVAEPLMTMGSGVLGSLTALPLGLYEGGKAAYNAPEGRRSDAFFDVAGTTIDQGVDDAIYMPKTQAGMGGLLGLTDAFSFLGNKADEAAMRRTGKNVEQSLYGGLSPTDEAKARLMSGLML